MFLCASLYSCRRRRYSSSESSDESESSTNRYDFEGGGGGGMLDYADGRAFIFVSNDREFSASVRGGTIVIICAKTHHILFPSKFFSSSKFIIGHQRIFLFDNPTHLFVVEQMVFCGQHFSRHDVFRRALNCLDWFDYVFSKMVVFNLIYWSRLRRENKIFLQLHYNTKFFYL